MILKLCHEGGLKNTLNIRPLWWMDAPTALHMFELEGPVYHWSLACLLRSMSHYSQWGYLPGKCRQDSPFSLPITYVGSEMIHNPWGTIRYTRIPWYSLYCRNSEASLPRITIMCLSPGSLEWWDPGKQYSLGYLSLSWKEECVPIGLRVDWRQGEREGFPRPYILYPRPMYVYLGVSTMSSVRPTL